MRLRTAIVIVSCGAAGACLGDLEFVRGTGAFCDLDTPCVAGHYCDLDLFECRPKAALAAECQSGDGCLSGFCADGMCCATDCEEACFTCDAPGLEGTCLAAPPGTDPHNDCPGTTQCGEGALCQASPAWSFAFGEGKDQTPAAMAVGADGRIALVGGFRGTVAFDKALQNITSERQAFVALFDGDGAAAWSLSFVEGIHEASGVAIDAEGAVYAVGTFEGAAMKIDAATPLAAGDGQNLFAVKLRDGLVAWAVAFGGPGDQRALGAAVADGTLVIVGDATDTTTFGACGDAGPPSGSGALMLALDAESGACTSVSVAGTSEIATSVAAVSDGFVIAGFGRGSATIGGIPLSASPSSDDVFVARIDRSLGAASWAIASSGEGDDRLDAVAVAGERVWAAGSMMGTLELPQGTLTSSGDRDALILQLDAASGAPLGVSTLGGAYDQEALAIAVTGSTAYVGGRFELSLDEVVGRGGYDAFVAALEPVGAATWTLPVGGRMHDAIRAVALDADANVIIAGEFQDVIRLGPAEIPSNGDSDILLAKLRP